MGLSSPLQPDCFKANTHIHRAGLPVECVLSILSTASQLETAGRGVALLLYHALQEPC